MGSGRFIQLLQVIDGKLVDTMSNANLNQEEVDNLLKSLKEWFGGKWVDISRPNVNKVAEDLAEPEAALADALVAVAERFGPFDAEDTGIWVEYETAEENEEKSIGVHCHNCVLYAGDGVCKILNQKVEHYGKCRFALIPDDLVSPEMEDEEEEDDDEEDSMSTLISLMRELLNKEII